MTHLSTIPDFVVTSAGICRRGRHEKPRTGLTGRNPCPKCEAEPALMCEAALTRGNLIDYDQAFYLVCWACNQILRIASGEVWRTTKLPRSC